MAPDCEVHMGDRVRLSVTHNGAIWVEFIDHPEDSRMVDYALIEYPVLNQPYGMIIAPGDANE